MNAVAAMKKMRPLIVTSQAPSAENRSPPKWHLPTPPSKGGIRRSFSRLINTLVQNQDAEVKLFDPLSRAGVYLNVFVVVTKTTTSRLTKRGVNAFV